MNIWNKINGHKTVLGAIVTFVAGVLKLIETSFGVTIIPQDTIDQLLLVGQAVIGVGLAHKIQKQM